MIPDRRRFLAACSSLGFGSSLLPGSLYTLLSQGDPLTAETVAFAEKIAGLTFTDEQRELLVEDLTEHLGDYAELRALELPNSALPAFRFDPRVSGMAPPVRAGVLQWEPEPVERPTDEEALACLPVSALAYLLKTRAVTSTDLTELYLSRLERYDKVLQAVVTLTRETAFAQAARADVELDAGAWRGPLHGIPYGAKDLLAVRGYPTTWGATPYQDQTIDEDAEVVIRLEAAGAVLLAKLTLGALAWGDVWFGGTTRNPWNVDEGASGSSAGPGAAVAAGLVGFAIGSETLGSIVSPSTRNGVTGHRPTFGLVSRRGAMTLSWSMDKLGPMARSALDCALILDTIRGVDPGDPCTVAAPFPFQVSRDVKTLRVAYLQDLFEGEAYRNQQADQATLDVLQGIGVTLTPIALPEDLPVGAMLKTLDVEAASAFDGLTREGGVDTMVRQGKNTWPHAFRAARFVPAVEFWQASRARLLLMQRMAETLRDVDVFVSPTFRGRTLRITNLTGHPCVCVPNAFHVLEDMPDSPRRSPGSITFIGGLYQDAEVLLLAHAYQNATDFHRRRPPIR